MASPSLLGKAVSSPTGDTVKGIHGEILGPADTPDTTLGGHFSSPFGRAGSVDPLPRGVYEVTLKKTGTDWEETFLVGVPQRPLFPAPVLVLFHGYGQWPRKLLELTTYFPEAMDRGWIVVAPLGAHIYNFAIDYAQQNTEKALDWVAKSLPVDPDRFYAVGFSMGGGGAASYAARHLDPKHARLAAVVNHTGTTSVADVYWNSKDGSLLASQLMFGGSPAEYPFRYSIASMMDLDTFTGQVNMETDLARNLAHISVKNFCAAHDPLGYLVNQTAKSYDQLVLRNVPTVITQSDDHVHKWSTLNEKVVLDYLETKSYGDHAPETVVRVLADRDGTWFHFDVEQRERGRYSFFRWTSVPTSNRLYVDEVANMERIGADASEIGLSQAETLEVVFANTDGGSVEIAMAGYSRPPADVRRGGKSTGSWYYDPPNDLVVLIETAGGNYPLWQIVP